jgi:hypothetical protein
MSIEARYKFNMCKTCIHKDKNLIRMKVCTEDEFCLFDKCFRCGNDISYYKENIKSDTGKYGSIQNNETGSLIVTGQFIFNHKINKIKHCPMCGDEIPEDRHICEACEFEDRS